MNRHATASVLIALSIVLLMAAVDPLAVGEWSTISDNQIGPRQSPALI